MYRGAKQLRARAPQRRTHRRAHRPRRSAWRLHLLLIVLAGGFAVVGWALLARLLTPLGNTTQSRFDVIVVLGARVDSDGNPSPTLLARTEEGVREYERGIAPRMILTGGPDGGRFVEAQAMEKVAESRGMPERAIYLEPNAMDTIQNACFATRIMKANGWKSAEIVTSPSHLPRAALIFSKTPIEWHMHAAPSVVRRSGAMAGVAQVLDVLKTVRYLLYAEWAERCSP